MEKKYQKFFDKFKSKQKQEDDNLAEKDPVADAKGKFKTYMVIALIALFTINILLGFFAWLFVENRFDNAIDAAVDKLKQDLEKNLIDDLRASITEDILKGYAKEHYLPADYDTIARYVYSTARPAVVEVICGNASDAVNATGLIINSDGYVLTNAHVVTYETKTQSGDINNPQYIIETHVYQTVKAIVNGDNNQYQMDIISYSTEYDLALIKFRNAPAGLHFVTFGDSDVVNIGEEVAVVANTLDWGVMVTTGAVAGTYKYNNMKTVQIDALTLEGNSGGGVFNVYGEMIGIISFKISGQLSGSLGCAVAVDEIKSFIAAVSAEKGTDINYTLSPNLPDGI